MVAIYVERDTMPEAWEEAVVKCWEHGDSVATEYDRPDAPNSRDCSLFMVVRRPFQEPRIHKAFPGGLEDLEVYRQEVTLGIHDSWVDPEAGKWSYTYHQRLFAYDLVTGEGETRRIDQFEYIIDKLARTPHSRRAQAITWKPDVDPVVDDPACLQRMWFRIFGDELRMNAHMRSNDAFKAAFMNMWAFTDLQRVVAEETGKRLGRELACGPYIHVVDSFHIYGSYFEEFSGFLRSLESRSFEQRVWRSDSDLVQGAFQSGRARIESERQSDSPGERIPGA